MGIYLQLVTLMFSEHLNHKQWMTMEQSQLFIIMLLVIQLWISVATRKFFVLPDNSTCTFQPCAIFSEYLLDNGTLPFVSNVQYYFLPGEHHIPANILLQGLQNFSIIGTVRQRITITSSVGWLFTTICH